MPRFSAGMRSIFLTMDEPSAKHTAVFLLKFDISFTWTPTVFGIALLYQANIWYSLSTLFHVNFYKNCPAAVHIATALLCNTYGLFPFFFFLFLSAKLFLLLKNAVKNICSSFKFKDASLKHSDREVVTALTYVTILPKFENSWLTFFMINLQLDLVG